MTQDTAAPGRRRSIAATVPQDPTPARVLHKRDFLSRVSAASDLPQAQIRAIVEATLAELGNAIAGGETLALPPFGKARVSRQKTEAGREVLVMRLRRPGSSERPD